MSRINAAITGVQGYVPDYVMTNKELETMVDTSDEWIRSRTGIETRHVLKGEGLGTSDMLVHAVNGLLEKTGTKPEEIDLVICATITGDMPFPDTANIVCDKVGIKNAFSYDINAACSGFLFALTTGSKFVESGSHKKVIIMGGDKMSSIIDYTDRTTCVIFGDGCGAVMLEPTTEDEGILDSINHSDGSGRHYLHLKAGGSSKPITHKELENREQYVYQNGRPVFKAAVSGMSDVVSRIMERNKLATDDITWLVPHQANMRIIETVSRMADFPMERVMVNINKYGNTTAGTLPLCLWDYENQIKKGDYIILTAFGGGFTWGATLIKWAY